MLLLLLIVISAASIFGIEALLRNQVISNPVGDDLLATWIGSVASYWGGAVGGILSGVFAFVGVLYTLRYYKEADAQKERASIQPFLHVSFGSEKKPTRGYTLCEQSYDKDKGKQVNITIRNIGNGFANALVIRTGFNIGGLEFKEVFTVGEKKSLFLIADVEILKNGAPFELQYIDSMANEYVQHYSIKVDENDCVDIDNGYPMLLEQ